MRCRDCFTEITLDISCACGEEHWREGDGFGSTCSHTGFFHEPMAALESLAMDAVTSSRSKG